DHNRFTGVHCCCSTRRICARGSCSRLSKRARWCLSRRASVSTPFIRITRTRVKASSSSLLMGRLAISFQVNCCCSNAVPLLSNIPDRPCISPPGGNWKWLLWDQAESCFVVVVLGIDGGIFPRRRQLNCDDRSVHPSGCFQCHSGNPWYCRHSVGRPFVRLRRRAWDR